MRTATTVSGILFVMAALFVISYQPTQMEMAIRGMMPPGSRCTHDEGTKIRCEYAPELRNELSVLWDRTGTTETTINPAQKVPAYIDGVLSIHKRQGFGKDEISTCIREASATRLSRDIEHGSIGVNCFIDKNGALVIRTQKSNPF